MDWTSVLVAIIAATPPTIGVLVALAKAKKAQKRADDAYDASPFAQFDGLRTQVDAVLASHQDSLARWTQERELLETAFSDERQRAEQAEARNITLIGQIAQLRIDQAAARSEIAELRARFETMIGGSQP